uniref:Uncharacterized protein n=1 Tax=Arundo donax TaxID=35708 RepID=A0A0A8Y7Y8_ARUDO
MIHEQRWTYLSCRLLDYEPKPFELNVCAMT